MVAEAMDERDRTTVSSWGRLPGHVQFIEPATGVEKLAGLMQRTGDTVPVGLGRSYGDSGIASGGTGIGVSGINGIGEVDIENGRLSCDAGASLGSLLVRLEGTGWTLPVVPGTRNVTVGGAIANDIHGKNHHSAGTFGRHVRGFELLRSDGERLRCRRDENPDWFEISIGGLGLTGVVTRAELQLQRSRGPWFDVGYTPFSNLTDFFQLNGALATKNEYTVAWFDCAAKGNSLGRGIYMASNPSQDQEAAAPRAFPLGMPFTLPFSLVNRPSILAYNQYYFYKHKRLAGRVVRQYQEPFLFPLDSIAHWNRIYGANGFQQFQCVVPEAEQEDAIGAMLGEISRSGLGSFLAILKQFGDLASPGPMSFPMAGTTLALDFPQTVGLAPLLGRLDEIVATVGGRIYPAKDAHMGSAHFKQFYPAWERLEQHRDPTLCSRFWARVALNTDKPENG
jgi:FAD/FMN-containing dehydrogenase